MFVQILLVFLSLCNIVFVLFFFFQAEDGIRDLVRSRGLGDVYKRQLFELAKTFVNSSFTISIIFSLERSFSDLRFRFTAVSYTHLTLPTSDLV